MKSLADIAIQFGVIEGVELLSGGYIAHSSQDDPPIGFLYHVLPITIEGEIRPPSNRVFFRPTGRK